MAPPPRAQAILLLTVRFGRADPPGLKPLAIGEWNALARWLGSESVTPEALLGEERDALLASWAEREAPSPKSRRITQERLTALLGRGMALGILLERWSRAGLWVVTRSEPDYPERFVKRLRHRAPPVLFGAGDRALLGAGGVAVVGSRKAGTDALRFAADLGRRAAEQGLPIVSGDARGVDRTAMEGSLDAGGTAVGVLPGELMRSASSRRHRGWLVREQLTLVSTFPPETRWRGWQAMDRNKHIYCLADAGVVVTSARGRSGTWAGATEALEKDWVPVWVRRSDRPGNTGLAERGARWVSGEALDQLTLLFDRHAETSRPRPPKPLLKPPPEEPPEPASPSVRDDEPSLYDVFLRQLGDLTADHALDLKRIAKTIGIQQVQANDWVKKGVESGQIEKRLRPVRYRRENPPGEEPAPVFREVFFQQFARLSDAPMRRNEIASSLGLRPGQTGLWLRKGIEAGRIRETRLGYTVETMPQPLFPSNEI